MHIITWLKAVEKFTSFDKYGITSNLNVDNNPDTRLPIECGNIIGYMDNGLAEAIEYLDNYYTTTGNTKMLAKLKKTFPNYDI